MEKMLVTQALNELKLLDSRINRKIEEANFVCSFKKSSINANGKVTKEEFKSKAKSSFYSIVDLITRRNSIKSAIVSSNAVTYVEIGNKRMTVAEAIERKSSIEYDRYLLTALQVQLSNATVSMTKENQRVDSMVEELLKTTYGKDSKEKLTEEMYMTIAKPYKENNEHELVDGIDIENVINTLKEDIETFLSNVDTVLQVSNSTTFIEF